MDKQLDYEIFRELFRVFGINPFEFRELSGDRLKGYFPNLPDREPMFNIEEFANVLWGDKDV